MATILIFGEDLPSATTTGLGSSLDKYGEGEGWIPREESEEMWIKQVENNGKNSKNPVKTPRGEAE